MFELVVGPLVYTVGEQFFFLTSHKKSELHHRQMHWTSFRTTENDDDARDLKLCSSFS